MRTLAQIKSGAVCLHSLTEYCDCIQRRPATYVAPHVAMRGPGERLPAWRCTCTRPDGRFLLRKHRHVEPWQCIPEGVAQAFRILHPEIRTLANARRLLWMAREFGGQ